MKSHYADFLLSPRIFPIFFFLAYFESTNDRMMYQHLNHKDTDKHSKLKDGRIVNRIFV